MHVLSIAIAALYGEGDFRSLARVARHSQILTCLRKSLGNEKSPEWAQIIEALRKDNFTQEAVFLMNETHVRNACKLLNEGLVITLACESYPKLLLTNLGVNAPPILWITDPSLRKFQPWHNNDGTERICIAGIGCRNPLTIGLAIAREVGLWTANNGYLGISGGSVGCDSAFGESILGAGSEVVHILPHGIYNLPKNFRGYGMSVCPPNEPFSSVRAMERNSLIYAFSHMGVVCSARYRLGGSWQGAFSAIKAHKPVVVADWTSQGAGSDISEQSEGTYGLAQRALASMGAHPMMLDLRSFRSDVNSLLDSALEWSIDKMTGSLNTGLFAS